MTKGLPELRSKKLTLEQQIEAIEQIILSVKPGGKINIMDAEADPEIFRNHKIGRALQVVKNPMSYFVDHYGKGCDFLEKKQYGAAISELSDALVGLEYFEKYTKLPYEINLDSFTTKQRNKVVDYWNKHQTRRFAGSENHRKEPKNVRHAVSKIVINDTVLGFYNDIGYCYLKLQNLDSAEKYLEKAKIFSEQIGEDSMFTPNWLRTLYSNLAKVYGAQGKTDRVGECWCKEVRFCARLHRM